MSKYPKKELAQLVLQHCIANEIENVVISPGSRNAPLTIGFVNHPKINTLSVVDERSAAFFALGISQQSKKPVVVLCSSGSALLNYYPAVAEAYYSNLPLIVISADRPKHLIDIGDGQTIHQKNVFEDHIIFSANLNEEPNKYKENNESIKEVFKLALEKKGPVHINVPFDEPLYETVEEPYDFEFKIEKYVNKKLKNSLLDEVPLDIEELQKFATIWNNATKKIVLIGANYPDTMIQTQLNHLIKDPSVLVFTETLSNVYNDNFVNSIDQLLFPLDEKELKKLQPEILLTIGGMIVSKKVKQFFRKFQPKLHWHADSLNSLDTYHCLSHHFNISPQLFFSQFFFLCKFNESEFQNNWLEVKKSRKIKHNLFLDNVEFSDLKVFDIILKGLPERTHLQLSNSSVIRYSQLFDLNNTLQVFCNRGTSGIDGSTSTAIGASFINKDQTVFISGDISFFYDSNALWNKYIKNDFRIIIINNSGGGIFRFIPGPKSTNALDYFETPHKLDAVHLSKMYGFEYASAHNETDLEKELKLFYASSVQPKLLEIFTPSIENDKVLKKYFSSLV